MKLVTWNVNSIKARAELVTRFLDAEAPDLLCIQELKMDAERVPRELFEERGYQVAFHAQKRWNGVLIASRSPIEQVHRGLEGADEGQARLVAGVTAGLRVVNLYCPQGQAADSPKFSYKLAFYDGLIAWLSDTLDAATPTLVVGDLNIAPGPDDLWDPARFEGVPTYHPEELARWEKLLALGLSDVVRPHIPAKTFSFWDYRGGSFHRKQGMRIDHILANPAAAERVEGAWVGRDWRRKRDGLTASDHAPVFATLSEPPQGSPI